LALPTTGAALFKVTFDHGTPSLPQAIATGLNFPEWYVAFAPLT
jgi:hypothetical protein